MSILDKTRKILWARSGNKCAICKFNLVNVSETICGNECHIISTKVNGPRHQKIQDYDSISNLILLCSNCHKVIDTQIEYYTVEILKERKKTHENEIKILIESHQPNKLFPQINGITLLPIINTGKELFNILDGSKLIEYDFENTTDKNEIEFIADTMQDLTDHMDLFGGDCLPIEKIKSIRRLDDILIEIRNNNFMLFGEKKIKKWKFGDNSPNHLKTVYLSLLRSDNQQIVGPNQNT